MGLVGLFPISFRQCTNIAGVSIVFTKFIQGYQFFSVIPIVFCLKHLWSHDPVTSSKSFRKHQFIFIVFTALILMLSMGRNSRAVFVVPLACLFWDWD